MILPREFYIHAWSNLTRVADKKSDAVAYIGTTPKGDPAAALFYGKQAKPVHRSAFRTEQQREQCVARYFAHRQQYSAGRQAQRAERSATGRGVEVGTVLASSWGYDQTNVNFYVVIELRGRTQAVIRACASMSVGSPDRPGMTDKVVPNAEALTGEPRTVTIRNGACKVGHQRAHTWDGQPMYTSSYA